MGGGKIVDLVSYATRMVIFFCNCKNVLMGSPSAYLEEDNAEEIERTDGMIWDNLKFRKIPEKSFKIENILERF